jgi:hypothetical protein
MLIKGVFILRRPRATLMPGLETAPKCQQTKELQSCWILGQPAAPSDECAGWPRLANNALNHIKIPVERAKNLSMEPGVLSFFPWFFAVPL